jgi:hypothetical protein
MSLVLGSLSPQNNPSFSHPFYYKKRRTMMKVSKEQLNNSTKFTEGIANLKAFIGAPRHKNFQDMVEQVNKSTRRNFEVTLKHNDNICSNANTNTA